MSYQQNLLTAFFLLSASFLNADLRSIQNSIDFKPNGTAIEMTLDSVGLGIGTTTPAANLHVMGNAIVNQLTVGSTSLGSSNLQVQGTIAFGIQNVSSDTTLNEQSVVMADTSTQGDLYLTLPVAANVDGRIVTIKSTNSDNLVYIATQGSTLDNNFLYSMEQQRPTHVIQ